jgi:hypothetical protein
MNIQKFLVLGFLLFIGSCKEKPTTPIDPDAALPPGRRDYTWTVDTLRFQSAFGYLRDIWGSSPNDIWAIASAGDLNERLWHYDGQHWTPQVLSSENYINPTSIFGFSQNNVWIIADEGRFLHYDGQSWSMFAEFSPLRTVEYPYMYCQGIWGDAPNNVYAVGFVQSATNGNKFKANIMHFDGTRWDSVPIPELKTGFVQIYRGIKESDKYFISGDVYDSLGTTHKIFEFDGHYLHEIFSSRGRELAMDLLDGRVYFCEATQILKYNGAFQTWKDFTNTGVTIYDIRGGRNSKDLFIASPSQSNSRQEVLRHFNGSDLKLLYDQIPVLLLRSAVFTSDFFIGAWTIPDYTQIIIHGKLKN